MDENRPCCHCCDENGSYCIKTKRCRYYCPCPPLLIDAVYHRFREPCLAIICMLIIIAFGSANIYQLQPLTCDQMYIVDPTCQQTEYPTYHNMTLTETHLISQNNVFYEKSENKYHFAREIDTISTFIILIGNSPYHSPIWLFVGLTGSIYSTYVYTDSIEYCSGNYCKTKDNKALQIDSECNVYINQTYQFCFLQIDTDSYLQCTQCLCLNAAMDSCMQYMNGNRGPIDRLHILMSYFWFILIYLRQIVTIILIIKVIYKTIRQTGNKNTKATDAAMQLELMHQKLSVNESNISGYEPEIVQNNTESTDVFTKWNSNSWYKKLFVNPLSVRLTAASYICMVILIILCQILYEMAQFTADILSTEKMFGLRKSPGVVKFITSLLYIEGVLIVIVYLRSIWMVHCHFHCDVFAIYSYYKITNVNNENNDIKQSENSNENKILTKLKWFINKLFPIKVPEGEHIISHVKKCRIIKAYLFIFMYPISLISGCILLFIAMALPVTIIIIISVVSHTFWLVIEMIYPYTCKIIIPVLGAMFVDRCILRGNTDNILTRRKVNCLWYVLLGDIILTMTSALFMTLWNIFVMRMVYSLMNICYGLIHPYRSIFPTPFETYDKVYQSYCANVALAALALLKESNQKY